MRKQLRICQRKSRLHILPSPGVTEPWGSCHRPLWAVLDSVPSRLHTWSVTGTQRGWGHSVWDAAPAFEGLGPLEEAGPQAPCAASNMVAQVADSMVSSGGWKRGGLHLQLGSLGLSAGPQSSFADGWAPGPHLCLDGCFYGSVLRASRWDFIWGKSSIAFIKRIADLGGILHREEVCGTLCGSCLNWGIPPSVSVILSYLLLSLKIIDEKRVWRQYNVCN